MEKIFFNGYYGYSNTGDNAFMEVAAWGARNIWGLENVFFHTPKNSQLPILQTNATFYKDLYIKGNYRVQKHYHLSTSKYLVSAGGSIFCKSISNNDIKSEFLKFNKKKKVKGAIGVSIGPFSNIKDELSVTQYLQKLDFLTLRDNRSFEVCKSMCLPFKPILASDMAALLPEAYHNLVTKNKENKKDIKTIGISYCKYETYIGGDPQIETTRENQLILLINELLKDTNIEINFLIFNDHPILGDYDPAKQLISKLRPIRPNQIQIIPFQNNVFNNWGIIQNLNLVICTRLHAAIFSCFANTPFIMMNYHPKCKDFADDIGVENDYIMNNQNFEFMTIINTIREILFNNNYIAPVNKENIKNRAILNFEATKGFIN